MMAHTNEIPRLSIRNATVRFGAITALDNVSFEAKAGEIVGLVGHNGAGKSTLVNIATGAVRPQRGELLIDGTAVSMGDPQFLERHGNQVIHQEPALCGNLSITDNICLARPEENLSGRQRDSIARDALRLLDCDFDPERKVSTLDFHSRQLVDLARALSGEVKVLFLDEPTAALGKAETDRLHGKLQELARQGKAIVYVSHRLRDIVEVCDRVVVMREGRMVMDSKAHDLTAEALSHALAPNADLRAEAVTSCAGDSVALAVQWEGQHFDFCRGEIVGLFGMAGGPQNEFIQSLYGIGRKADAHLQGRPYSPAAPSAALRRGVGYVHSDREREQLLPLMSGGDNVCMPWLGRLSRFGFISRNAMSRMYARAREALKMFGPPMDAPITAFSGGNRQKHVLGRWLFGGDSTALLLLCQPVQGVDIEARYDIARVLREAAKSGVTTLVASSEADEIALLCDRAMVCHGSTWETITRSPDWEKILLEKLIAGTTRKGKR